MVGYGLKAFIIVQDLTQLQKAYGREEAITSNCHVRIAFAPNKIETAKLLSDMAGKTTLIQKKHAASHGGKSVDVLGGSVSDSQSEVARPLLTPDECMALKGLESRGAKALPGDMLIFIAGKRPIYGRHWLYFQNPALLKRAQSPQEEKEKKHEETDTRGLSQAPNGSD